MWSCGAKKAEAEVAEAATRPVESARQTYSYCASVGNANVAEPFAAALQAFTNSRQSAHDTFVIG